MALVQWDQDGRLLEWDDGGFDPTQVSGEIVRDSRGLVWQGRYKHAASTFLVEMLGTEVHGLAGGGDEARELIAQRLRIKVAQALRADALGRGDVPAMPEPACSLQEALAEAEKAFE